MALTCKRIIDPVKHKLTLLTTTPHHRYNIGQRASRQLSTMSLESPHTHISSHHKRTKPNEKHPQFGHLPLSTSGPIECALTGSALLNTPYLNKGAGFPAEERRQFKLTGLLPQHISSLEEQVHRAYQQYSSRQDDLAKNTFMTSLAEQNEVLYFRVSSSL
jgi:malate dehydrogenase (oxaloacetate-decarboxylating)